jgi:class 3 adenylate cyclase
MTVSSRLATIFNADAGGYSHLMGAPEQSTLILRAVHRLTADGLGYSGLIKAGEEGMLERLKAHCREIVEPKIKEHRGRILEIASDGMLGEFASPVDAVRCAVEVQQTMTERNARTAADKRLTFRIAVDVGNVATKQAVDISARLRALADPGGVCISHGVYELIRDQLQYAFRDIGECSVKNVAAPVRAYAMSAEAVASAPRINAQTSPVARRNRVSARSAAIAASVALTIATWTAAWWSWGIGNSPTTPVRALVAANAPTAQLSGNASDKPTQASPVLVASPAPTEKQATPPITLPTTSSPATQSLPSQHPSAEIAALVARGDAFLSARDIASARLFYERAADGGDGGAALRLGETFDPGFLSRTGIRGVPSDPTQASSWYRRALELGNLAAQVRLKNLEQRVPEPASPPH